MEAQTEQVQTDPISQWWAGRKGPKSELSQQLEESLFVGDADIPQTGKDATMIEAEVSQPASSLSEPVPAPANHNAPARKRRSDAGVPKGPKLVEAAPTPAAAPAGGITTEQKNRLTILMSLVEQAACDEISLRAALEAATVRKTRAQSEFTAFVNSLTV